MNEVFILTTWVGGGYCIHAVLSTREKAEKVKKDLNLGDSVASIVPYQIDTYRKQETVTHNV